MLIIVDLQNDFIEGGKLAVNGGLQTSKNIQKWISENLKKGEHVVMTADWHPVNHCSFSEWPEHCVKNTAGAAFEESLIKYLEENQIGYVIAHKGTNKDKDAYSFLSEDIFKMTYRLNFAVANRIVVTGIVGTVCVKNTITDIIEMGFGDKIYVPVNCVANFDEKGKQEFVEFLINNHINYGD